MTISITATWSTNMQKAKTITIMASTIMPADRSSDETSAVIWRLAPLMASNWLNSVEDAMMTEDHRRHQRGGAQGVLQERKRQLAANSPAITSAPVTPIAALSEGVATPIRMSPSTRAISPKERQAEKDRAKNGERSAGRRAFRSQRRVQPDPKHRIADEKCRQHEARKHPRPPEAPRPTRWRVSR